MPALDRLLDIGFEPGAAPAKAEAEPGMVRITTRRPAMGTLVTLQLVGRSEAQLADAAEIAFAGMQRLVAILGRRDAATPLAHLNRAGALADAPPALAEVVRHALAWHHATDGAFDVTVAPLVELFEAHAESASPSLPSEAEVREARERVGAAHVRLRGHGLRFDRPAMAMTLDGIAKGYIVDAMAAALERHSVRRYLVEAGGDIRARGFKAGRRPWRIAVQDPDGRGRFPDVLDLSRGAVATSGSYERRFDPDEIHHHIVDPKAGRSPTAARSVTAVAPTATAADALATSVFLLGPAEGCRFTDRLPGCACLVLDRQGLTHRSRAWKSAAMEDTT